MTDPSLPQDYVVADVKRRRFSAIWVIPLVAGMVAGYLAVRSYHEHGHVISINFRTGEGLTPGQTPVKYKAVTLGVVEDVSLTDDMKHVTAHVRMSTAADPLLNDQSRFWVVKPRINTTNISDLETLVSGTYIAVSPGEPGGVSQDHFTGLEEPPALQADGKGSIFVVKTDALGSIRAGSPVYYRDIDVGQVLNYDLGDGYGPITLNLFVHAPYDRYVKPNSHFWNASGLTVKVGAGGLKIELQSLQSILAGGIAFDTPPDAHEAQSADDKAVFELYQNRATADAAIYDKRVSYASYFQSSIKDLAPGSPVQIFGIQVGSVTDIKLVFDKNQNDAKVRVAFDVQPQRAFGTKASDAGLDPVEITRQLVDKGMRVKLESSNLIAGQEVLALEFVPKTEPADIAREGDAIILPGVTGGFDNLTDALGDVAGKLNQIPFDSIGKNLSHLIGSADQTFAGPEMKQAMHSLAVTLANAEDLSRKANDNLTPALQRLPDISAQLQSAVTHANEFMASMDNGYGANSDFSRSAKRVMDEVNDAARSIRLLADFLDRHPEALVRGKPPQGSKQ